MLNHLRICMTADVLPIFHGPVELDETYIGGQRKNKRLHIRRIKAKKGHGTDKLPIVGLFDRASGKAFVIVEPKKLDIHFILFLLRKRVVPHAFVYTDGFKMYRMLPKHGWRHEYVDHDGGELARGEIHTNHIEGFWGILKRKLSCIGGMRRKHLPLFVGEIAWRFNHRNIPLSDQEKILFELIARKKFGGRS
jgi:transposase-like protein